MREPALTIATKKTAAIASAAAPVLALSLLARYCLLPFESGDWTHHLRPWMDFISLMGHFAALEHHFSNYNVPYLYLLATASLFDAVPDLIKIKSISIVFDYVMAFFVYRIVRLKHPEGGIAPIAAGLATICLPTVVLNGSAWGQCDSIWTAFLVMSLYCLLAGRQKMACAAFGLAFSFKPMGIFLAPLFLWLLARREVRPRNLFLIPAVWLGLLLPAWLIGRPLGELLLIYPNSIMYKPRLAPDAPNLHALAEHTGAAFFFRPAGVIAAMIFVVVTAALLCMNRTKLTKDAVVLLATFSVLVLPWILPFMHDRYFFPADVISIILAFYFPRLWHVPAMIGSSSLLSYSPTLLGVDIVPPSVTALVMLFAIGVLGREVVRTFAGKTFVRRASTGSGREAGGQP